MKNKLITTGIVAAIVLGGALGVNAFEGKSKTDEMPKQMEEMTQQEDVIGTDVGNEQLITTDSIIQKMEEKFDSIVTEIELDEEDGRLVYEMELYNEKANVEIELEVDAYNAEVLSLGKEYNDHKKEYAYDYKNRHELVDQKKQAIHTALSAENGNILDVDYDENSQNFIIAVKGKNGVTILTIDQNNKITNKTTKSYKEYFRH